MVLIDFKFLVFMHFLCTNLSFNQINTENDKITVLANFLKRTKFAKKFGKLFFEKIFFLMRKMMFFFPCKKTKMTEYFIFKRKEMAWLVDII